MTEYVMLECNRLRGRETYHQISEEEDQFKNRWINNVSSYGIVINKGDIISVDTSCINTQGTIQDTIEILAENNEQGYLDSKVGFNFSYYINHTGFNSIPLPFSSMRTYLTYDGSHDYTEEKYVLNRGIGEPDFSNYPTSVNEEYDDENQMPSNFTIIPLKVVSGGGGFEPNSVYSASATGGYQIQAQQVESGVMLNYTLVKVPITTTGGKITLIIDTNDTTPVKPPSTPATIDILMPDLSKASTKKLIRPDGSRYFPASKNWSGCAMTTGYVPADNPNTNMDAKSMNPTFSQRKKQVDVEIPAGLNSPQNIGSLITSQFQRPKRVDLVGNEPEFCNLENYRHPVIETNATLTSTCNFSRLTSPYAKTNSFTGVRRLFYSNIALKNPEKWEGLQFSRQFHYDVNNDQTSNEINSGVNQTGSRGDFGSQTVGDLGMNMCITRSFPDNNTLSQIAKGDLILTNVYCTEENIKKIASGFRIAEKYYGDRTVQLSANSQYYTDGLAVPLDIGFYVDEKSSGTLGTHSGATVINQRYRFMSGKEASVKSPTDPIYHSVDRDFTALGECRGTQPPYFSDSNTDNDGQQLSHLLVKSRYTTTYNGDELLTHLKNASAGTMRVASNYTTNQLFNGTNVSQILKVAKEENVGIVPVYLDNTEADFYKFGGRPYIAFVSHNTTNTDLTKKYDVLQNTNWMIDSRNMLYGMPIGLDTSFIRNDAVAMINTNFRDEVKSGVNLLRLNSFDASTTNPSGIGPFQKILCTFINLIGQVQQKEFANYNLIPHQPSTVSISDMNVDYVPVAPYTEPEFIGFVDGFPWKITISNLNTTSLSGVELDQFTPYINLGAYELQFLFNSNLSRFSFSDMNTPTRVGNGQPYELPSVREYLGLISSSPETQVVNYALTNSCFTFNQFIPSGLTITPNTEYAFSMIQSEDDLIDTQTGICLYSLILESDSGNTQTQVYTDPLTMTLSGTLLGKMGYEIEQLFSLIGGIQTKFNDYPTFKNTSNTYTDFIDKFTRPLTTSAIFSSAEYQALQTSTGGEPLYLLGGADNSRSRPSVVQGSLTAFNLPTQLDYPYLCVYSSIPQGGTTTQYIGGIDSQSKIPCMAIITRYNNSGSFFYGVGNSFDFTASKDFTLTEIETDIRLPNGDRPRLLPHSSVIYRIQKPIKQLFLQPK